MSAIELSPEQWSKIYGFLTDSPDVYAGNKSECRRFLEAVLWITRSGAQWRLLPSEYGKWNSVYKRFIRWSEKGVWERMHGHFVDDADMENLIIDSTIIRAHPCAGGASRKKGANPPRAWVEAGEVSAPRCM